MVEDWLEDGKKNKTEKRNGKKKAVSKPKDKMKYQQKGHKHFVFVENGGCSGVVEMHWWVGAFMG